MSSTVKFVFLFAVMALVLGGTFIVAASMFSEPAIATTIPTAESANVNQTTMLIGDVGIMATDFMIPALILIAVIVVISAIYLITKKR